MFALLPTSAAALLHQEKQLWTKSSVAFRRDVANLLTTKWDEDPAQEAGVVDLAADQDSKAAPAPAKAVAGGDAGPSTAT